MAVRASPSCAVGAAVRRGSRADPTASAHDRGAEDCGPPTPAAERARWHVLKTACLRPRAATSARTAVFQTNSRLAGSKAKLRAAVPRVTSARRPREKARTRLRTPHAAHGTAPPTLAVLPNADSKGNLESFQYRDASAMNPFVCRTAQRVNHSTARQCNLPGTGEVASWRPPPSTCPGRRHPLPSPAHLVGNPCRETAGWQLLEHRRRALIRRGELC